MLVCVRMIWHKITCKDDDRRANQPSRHDIVDVLISYVEYIRRPVS